MFLLSTRSCYCLCACFTSTVCVIACTCFTDSSPVLPVDTLTPSALTLTEDFRYFYTHHQKVPTSEPVPINPFPVDSPQLSTPPSDLYVLLPFEKVTGLALIILFRILHMIIFTLFFVSLLHLIFGVYPGLVRRFYWYLPGSRSWMRR